jgi:hypothetical protein
MYKNRNRFTVDENFYYKNKIQYARVSTILDTIHDAGIEKIQRARGFGWFDDVMAAAADRGKRFHNAMKMVATDKFSPMVDESYRQTQSDIYPDIVNEKKLQCSALVLLKGSGSDELKGNCSVELKGSASVKFKDLYNYKLPSLFARGLPSKEILQCQNLKY